jgi:circadian clock protein KaiC
MQSFIQRLALFLASWQATTFLIGEYVEDELRDNPIFTVADGLFWLRQSAERNSVVRKLQIIKLRGQASVPGLHTFRITNDGLQAFSRTFGLTGHKRKEPGKRRLSIGIPELDKMMGGGIPEGDSVLITGASGTGLDLSVDETMQAILDAVQKVGAKRLVIDSLAGFEMALSPGFREDFRESLYRMIFALTGIGVTVLSTVEVDESFTEFLSLRTTSSAFDTYPSVPNFARS